MSTGKRDQLVDTAIALFERDGYRATGIDTIVAQAGVAKMTLYKHFPSKDDLVVETIRVRSRRVFEALEARVGALAQAPADRPMAFFDAAGEQCASRGFTGCPFCGAAREYHGPDEPPHRAAVDHMRRVLALLERYARDAGVTDRPAEVASAMLLLYTGAVAAAQALASIEPFGVARSTTATLIAAHRAGAASP